MFKSGLAVLASVLIFTLCVTASGEKCETYKKCDDCIKHNCTYFECQISPGVGDGVYNCSPSTSCEKVLNATTTGNCSTSPVSPIPIPSSETVSSTDVTTVSSETSTSDSTTQPTRPTVTPSGRHFDAPSFIGGTVLSLGLLAIIYVGFKFYKARTERNYHTL